MADYEFKLTPLNRYHFPLVAPKEISEEVNGKTYQWFETVPANLPVGKVPLVVKLHGGGTNARFAHDNTSWARLAAQEGFICAFPTGQHRGWNVRPDEYTDEMDYLDYIMDRVIEKYDIDETRIYLTGMSMGDMMTLAYSCRRGIRIAALASFCGPTYEELAASRLPEYPVPVMQIRGEVDIGGGFGAGESEDKSFDACFERKQGQITFDREEWFGVDGISGDPEFFIDGIQNYSLYRGSVADLYFVDVTGMGHREASWAPYVIWKSFFTGYRRVDGKVVRTEPLIPLSGDKEAAVFAPGSALMYSGGVKLALDPKDAATVAKLCVSHPLPGDPEPPAGRPAMSQPIYAESVETREACYVPVETLNQIPGVKASLAPCGKSCVVSAYGKDYTIFANSMLIETADKVHLGLEKPVTEIDGRMWVPVAYVCDVIGKCVSVRENVVYVAEKKADMSKGMARRLKKALGL